MKHQDKKKKKKLIIHGDVPDCTIMPKEEPLNHVREENLYKLISLCVLSSTIFTYYSEFNC